MIGFDAAEPAVAALVIKDRSKKLRLREVGPQRLGDVQLGVCDLPQEEVTDAHFPGRADQKIRIGHVRGVQVRRDCLFVYLDAIGGSVSARIIQDGVDGVYDFRTSAVVDGEIDAESGVAARGIHSSHQFVANLAR